MSINVNDIAKALQSLIALQGSPAPVDSDEMVGTPAAPTPDELGSWDDLLNQAARSVTPTSHDVRERAQGKRVTWIGGLHTTQRSAVCSLELRSADKVALGKLAGWCKLAKLRTKDTKDGNGFYVKPRNAEDVSAMQRLVLLAPGLDGVDETEALRIAEALEVGHQLASALRPDDGELAARERVMQETAATFLGEMARRREKTTAPEVGTKKKKG